MSVTIYDVAKHAGVGIGTVSRVINNSPQLSAATRTRVLDAIHELHFQPHAMARGLARKKTNTIAAIVPFFTGYFFLELLRGVQLAVTEHKYDLILYSLDHPDKTEGFLERTLRERRVDGVLLISLNISDQYALAFQERRLPIVLVDSSCPTLDSITVQNREGAYTATEHLIRLGHTRIAMINGRLVSVPAKVRLEGYQQALKHHSIPFRNEYLIISDLNSPQDGFNQAAGYEGMKKLIGLGKERPSAVFFSSDIQAVGGIRAVQDAELQIPGDFAVIGFDDIELAEYLSLSTMRQPMFEMGSLAVERLMERINGSASGILTKRFSAELVIRKSTDPLISAGA